VTLVATPETAVGQLCRVRLAITSAPAAADTALIERSTDQIRWSTVRGGEAVPLTAAAGHLDDYEFTPNVLNYYRVSYVDAASPTAVAAGAATIGTNASVTPALPAGILDGDLLVIFASIRNSGAGAVATPAGWTQVGVSGNIATLARRYTTGVVAPLVTFTGGVANATTMARMVAVRNAHITPVTVVGQLNAIQQNMPYPDFITTVVKTLALYHFWKQDDWTSVSPAATWSDTTVTGDDASLAIYPVDLVTAGTNPGASITVTGGATAISRVLITAFKRADWISQETTSTTPAITSVWFKHIRYPFLNTALSVPVGELEVSRKARAGVFPVVGRTLPVGVTDKRLGKEFVLGARVEDDVERERLDLVLQTGEAILLQVPASVRLPSSMYATIGDDKYLDESRTFVLPLTQVAAPAASIVGTTTTYAGVLAAFASYTTLLSSNATYAAVLELTGSPSDIITG
jgi:hypothetical protein